ncbi:Gfo/Idh/MocA family oxidoreductase [Streptomyces sp. R302]|uniref:Gfo/Idh/MocA family protein n=1 Tax=unclassified Streptomyces TaxID=2593676 RepID=UPI00145EA146|nr:MULTISPECIES: Gfo/Idh/MocA family oxidoreductase [unclassified Streptomyces]NML50679.1 Gfo/Idh/MocA family oxidoreductase [Streptomyces sp. R301]NML80774.1 Gfo/Idh/MocA family oxidoreductase [Streptomyces sp. R302]
MIRTAIVGTGGIAGVCHVPALRAQAHRAEIVAAVDVDALRAEDFAAEHGIHAVYTDLNTMLREQRPDLVHLCTPPFLHAEQAVACLESGAWVWCEKPVALSLAELDRIQAAEGPAVAGAVFQHRYGSGARYLRDRIAAGALGRPLVAQCVTAWYRDDAYYDVPWRGTWRSEGGGPTLGHGIHQMDLMLDVLGPWAEVRAMAGRLDRDVQTEDVSAALVRFENGAIATVVNSVLSPREESYLRFDLTDATVELRHLYGYSNADWTFTARSPGARWEPPDDLPSSHTAQLAALLDGYEAGIRPDLGRPTMELVTALYKAAITGLPVRRGEIDAADPFYGSLHGGRTEVFR